jgi:hypothetical protein
MYKLDEGVVGSGMGLFLIEGPWALTEDSAAKLKRGQLHVCTAYLYTVYGVIISPAAQICARLDGNFFH